MVVVGHQVVGLVVLVVAAAPWQLASVSNAGSNATATTATMATDRGTSSLLLLRGQRTTAKPAPPHRDPSPHHAPRAPRGRRSWRPRQTPNRGPPKNGFWARTTAPVRSHTLKARTGRTFACGRLSWVVNSRRSSVQRGVGTTTTTHGPKKTAKWTQRIFLTELYGGRRGPSTSHKSDPSSLRPKVAKKYIGGTWLFFSSPMYP